mmetsp:Transcript_13116/g.38848  ORF Transcript_13116/g.38848 Transcript_13116/m.38848 type:complete len:296 (-) Transcript_13116:234-1121(-)
MRGDSFSSGLSANPAQSRPISANLGQSRLLSATSCNSYSSASDVARITSKYAPAVCSSAALGERPCSKPNKGTGPGGGSIACGEEWYTPPAAGAVGSVQSTCSKPTRKSALVRSPTPTGGRPKGSSGVAMCHASSWPTSSISNESSGDRPAWARCFTSTRRAEPAPSRARAARTTACGVSGSDLVITPSSSTFGHSTSALAALASAWCLCTPSGTTQPLAGWPITGSQQYSAAGFAALTRRTTSSTAPPCSSVPRYPERIALHRPSAPIRSMPLARRPICSVGVGSPSHPSAYCV